MRGQLGIFLLCIALLGSAHSVQAQHSEIGQAELLSTWSSFSDASTTPVKTVATCYAPFNPILTNSSYWLANQAGFDGVSIHLTGNFTAASDAMTQRFVNKLFFGGVLDNELKGDVRSKTGVENRLGFELQTELLVSIPVAERTKVNLALGRNWMEAQQFSGDLFDLLFYGNADRIDDQMLLGDFEVRNQMYQYLEVGIMQQRGDFSWGLNANLLQGITFQDAAIRTGSLYTAPDVSYLDLDISGEYRTTTSPANGSAFNGVGFAADAYLNYRFSDWMIAAEMENLGSINWESDSEQYKVDSTYRYDGFEVNELLDLSNDPISSDPDSLLAYLGLSPSMGNFSAAIPGTYRLHISRMLPQKQLIFTAGVEYRTNASSTPLAYVKGRWARSCNLSVASHLAYGGYMGLQWGAEVLIGDRRDRIDLQVGSSNLLGLISPGSMTMGTVYAGLSVNL